MKKFSATFILIFCLFTSVFPQDQVIFETTENESLLVRNSTDIESVVKNDMLSKLSEGNQKNASQFTFSYLQNLRIVRKGNMLEFSAALSNVKFNGDTKYRGFAINEVLFPKKIDFQLYWLKENNSLIKSFDYKNVDIESVSLRLLSLQIPDTLKVDKKIKIKLVNKLFLFDKSNKEAFDARVGMIDAYFKAVTDINGASAKISKVNFNENEFTNTSESDKVFEFKALADENDKLIHSVKTASFYTTLSLNTFDPEGLMNKLNTFASQNAQFMQSVNNLTKRMHELFYNLGLQMLSRGNYEEGQNCFTKSLSFSPLYAPSHYQLAKIDYVNKNLDAATQKLINLVQKMSPDQQMTASVTSLAVSIYSDYINQILLCNEESRFDEALTLNDKATTLCKNITTVTCSENLKTLYQSSIQGKYKSLFLAIDKSIASGNLIDAEKQVLSVKEYYDTHKTYLTNSTEVFQKLTKIYFEYISKGDYYNTVKQFENALIQYNAAQRICSSYQNVPCTDELKKGATISHTGIYKGKIVDAVDAYNKKFLEVAEKVLDDANTYAQTYHLTKDAQGEEILNGIKRKTYTDFISHSNELSKNSRFEEALQKLDSAKSLEQHYTFSKEKSLDSLIISNAKALIKQKYADGKKKIQENDLLTTRNNYNNAIKIQRQYNLLSDKDIISLLNEYNDLIYKEECPKMQAKVEALYNEGLKQIEKKEFFTASRSFDAAWQMADKNSFCVIDKVKIEKKREKIREAAVYQEFIDKANHFVRASEFQFAIDKYGEADIFFINQQIANFGLQHAPLMDFVLKNSSEFMIFIIKYYVNLGDFDSATKTLSELRKRDVNKNDTKDAQKLLGTQLAMRDKKASATSNPKETVLKYTNNDGWYKFLKNAYVEQWSK